MATAKDHYDTVLSDIYSWMLGGFDAGIQKNSDFFQSHKISPTRSAVAIDLGAGCGFQSIPLAMAGFTVTAIDIDCKLLNELKNHIGTLPISIIKDDLVNFDKHSESNVELIVCMTDTLLHLESKDTLIALFKKVLAALEKDGRFIVTFRDLSPELSELDRFIPVKSDDRTILSCFLEYEPEIVKVHDLLYRKEESGWTFSKSYYRKLRISKEWVDNQLLNLGFTVIESTVDKGFVTVIAQK